MTGCILSGIMCARPDSEGVTHLADERSQACFLGAQRLAGTLRAVAELVDELAGGGYVERDMRRGVHRRLLHDDFGRPFVYPVPGPADPVAHALTAGPINGRSGAPRVAGTGERSLPIRIDPTDLLARARPASLAVAVTGAYPHDQIGHLAVATELEFWARDWADTRRESCPNPTVPVLASWLLDRLDWACQTHPALDEFAGKLRDLRGALTAATGRLEPFPAPVDRPCPACGWWALSKAPGEDLIRCGHCDRALSDDEYRDHLEDVIKTNWTVIEPDDAKTWPADRELVWLRVDGLTQQGVTVGFNADWIFLGVWGQPLIGVSHWAPISYPADPGPRKEEAA